MNIGVEDILINVILLLAGALIGLGVAKAVKGLLLIILALIILFFFGFTIAGLISPEAVASLFGPIASFVLQLLQLLAKYPALAVGLLIGLLIGAVK
ncbi:MAG: hypothetical protein RMJ28_01035 [Nitrososphaerota archaeon]|nr:hypothetical protein [Candidatus Calditenuaceae archaeon]MDW8072816.1 hypothetical protein [Nitrososphaerota archaeon]